MTEANYTYTMNTIGEESQGGGELLPYKRLMGMCRWMGSHFHDWINYNGVAFSIELLEWARTFSDFLNKKILVCRDSKLSWLKSSESD